MPRVLLDPSRHTAIELNRGPKWVQLIPFGTSQLEISRRQAREVDLEYREADPNTYPLQRVARMYLRSHFPKSDNAREALEELAMPVILVNTKEAEIVARFETVEEAKAAAGEASDLLIADGREALNAGLTQEQMAALSNALLNTKVKRIKNKTETSGKLWEEIVKREPPKLATKPEPVKKERKARGEIGSGGHRIGSKKEKAHQVYLTQGDTKDCAAAIEKLGVKIGTARSWMAAWKRLSKKAA